MEKQQPESEDGIEGLRTTVRYPTAAKRKQEVGPGACAEKARACAVRGGAQSESRHGGRRRGGWGDCEN